MKKNRASHKVLPEAHASFRGARSDGPFRRGQASVEFILILLLAVLYLSAVVIPKSEFAGLKAEDTANLSKLVLSMEKLSNTIQYVSLSGEGTRQTIEIAIPENASMRKAGNNIVGEYDTKTRIEGGCTTETGETTSNCEKTINVGTNFRGFPTNPAPGTTVPGITTGLYRVTVEKTDADEPPDITFNPLN